MHDQIAPNYGYSPHVTQALKARRGHIIKQREVTEEKEKYMVGRINTQSDQYGRCVYGGVDLRYTYTDPYHHHHLFIRSHDLIIAG